jgi:CheY-like chemotaxis protein
MNEATLQEATILLVDDEPKNIQLLGNLLQQQGYAVEFATSGEEALQWVNTRTFDLILLDVMMPEMDGY